MRHYPANSPQAAGRILALAMVVDGHLAPVELEVLENSKLMQQLGIDQPMFQELLQDLLYDMLNTSAVHGTVEFGQALIDSLLEEIKQPDLRRKLLRAIWSIADADGWLSDAEAVLLDRACTVWSAESSFIDRAGAVGV